MATLETLEAKIDILLSRAVPATPQAAQPWERPELSASDLDSGTIDGFTVQADGSVWVRELGADGKESGKPAQLIYGYLSKAKVGPAMWDRMVRIMGSEERLQDALNQNGLMARYKMHPGAAVHAGAGNFVLLSYMLSNPITSQEA